MKNILVTGANGFVGTHLCNELLNHGYSVRAFVRGEKGKDKLQGLPVELAFGDITDKESLKRAMTGIDTVYHIAAVFREAKFPDSYYFKVNSEGSKNVLETACESGVSRVIHCSTTGVHGHIKDPPANESTPFAPRDVYQRSKCHAEEIVNQWIRSGKLKCTIIRPAMIWGPGDRRILKLFKGVRQGILPMIGNGKTLTHWIMIDDLVRAFRLAGEREEAVGETFIIAGERSVPISYVYSEIAKFFGTKPLPIAIPVFPLWLAGAIVEAICLPLGLEPPIFRRRVDFYTKDRSLDCTKARNLLNFVPTRTFEEEIRFLASWYVEHSWIPACPA